MDRQPEDGLAEMSSCREEGSFRVEAVLSEKRAMGGKRINIAYFTADWNRELVSVALSAVVKYLACHSEVHVQVFDCFSFALYSDRTDARFRIYDLPDLDLYDAVLVQAHEIMDTDAIRRLEQRILAAGIPAISVGAPMEGCIYIGTDDYAASHEMTEHLVKVHHARTFLYLKGYERVDGSGEAEQRRRAFEDVCRENGIPAGNISYYDGDWDSRKGRKAVEALIASGKPLPDAIVSANDEMALGALGALTDAGISVPQEVMVTGFDGILSASLSNPRLSTVFRDFDTLITTALEALSARIRGEDVPKCIYSPYKMVFSESCGCFKNMLAELPRIKRMYYANSRQQEKFYDQQDRLTADLFGTDSRKILQTVEKHYQIFGEGNLYIYACDYYFDQYISDVTDDDLANRPVCDTYVLAVCGGRKVAREEENAYMRISRRQLTDAPLLSEEQLTIFYSLHFQSINMGFLVLTQPPTVAEMHLHENIVNLCVFAIENARQRIRSEMLNQKLNALYTRDQLTGLYNRFGYDQMAETLFEQINDRGRDVHVLFLDIDNMKGINDRYGHEQGDLAIRTVSEVMNGSCRRDDFKMRYGGDEFVIITEAGKADLKGRLKENLRRVNESGTLPFLLEVSIGDYIVKGKKPKTLDDLLRRADELMYEEKGRKREAILQAMSGRPPADGAM